MLAAEATIGREPLTIVELDQDKCALIYGVAPCAAVLGVSGTRKCFNTRATCQDGDNYDRGTLTLRFAVPSQALPRDINFLPTVISVSTVPTEINIGGGDRNSSPLGRRASITISLKDHPYHDRLVDPYVTERDYDPLTRGTFWSKWLARNPFYTGRSIRIREGYAGQALGDMNVRHYVIDRIEGPNNGTVTIVAKDPIKLTDADRAQAPRANRGLLVADITDVAMSAELRPTGIGNSEYDASGVIRIGGELISFTRAGDILTFTERALRETEAAAHKASDVVQGVLIFDVVSVEEVVRDLLIDFTEIDVAFIDYAAWQAEAAFWLAGFNLTTWITQPTGVGQLLGEIMAQSLTYIWWDERSQKVAFRAVRPFLSELGDTITPVTAAANIVANSLSLSPRQDERISQVWIYYDQIDPTAGIDDPRNYRRLRIVADPAAESADQYGERRVKEIFSRWLAEGNDATTLSVAARLLARYRDNPIVTEFDLDAKDRALSAADVVELTHPDIVDDTGEAKATRLQVIAYEDVEPGHRVSYKCRPYGFSGRYAFVMANDAPDYADAEDVDLEIAGYIIDDAEATFPDGGGPYKII